MNWLTKFFTGPATFDEIAQKSKPRPQADVNKVKENFRGAWRDKVGIIVEDNGNIKIINYFDPTGAVAEKLKEETEVKILSVELNKPTNEIIYFNDLPQNAVVLGMTGGAIVGMFMRRKISEPMLSVPAEYGYYFYDQTGRIATGPHATLKTAIKKVKDSDIRAVIIENDE